MIFSRFVTSAFFSGVMQLFVVLSTLLVSVAAARVLGATQYSEYVYIISISSIFGIPCTVGMSNLLLRYGSKYAHLEEHSRQKGLWLACFFFIALYSAIILLVLVLLESQGFVISLFILSGSLVFFQSLHQSISTVLRSVGKVKFGQGVLALFPSTLFISLFLFVVVEVKDMIFLYVASLVFSSLVGILITNSVMGARICNSKANFELHSWKKSLFFLSFYSGINVIDGQVGILFLRGAETIDSGLLKIAISSAAFVSFGLTAINMMIAPKISALYSSKETVELQSLLTSSVRLSSFVAILIAAIFLILGDDIINLVYGVEYAEAFRPFTVLVFGSLVNTCFGSVVLILNMTGNEQYTLRGMFVALSVNVALCVILVPLFSVVGAAISTASSMLVWNLYLSIVIKNRLGLTSHVFCAR